MKKVSLLIHQDYLDNTIKELHKAGIVEIINVSKENPNILQDAEQPDIDPDAATCANYELRITRLIDILKKTKKVPKGLKAIINPPKSEKITMHERSIDEIFSYSESILHEIEENILDFENKLNLINEQITSLDNKIEQISYLSDFNLDLSDIGESSYLVVYAGKTKDLDEIKKEIDSIELAKLYSKQFGSGKKIEWAVVLIAHISVKGKIERIIREKITIFDLKGISGIPKDALKNLKNEKIKLNNDKKQIKNELKKYSSAHLNDLLATREEINLERNRKDIIREFAKTKSTFIVNGWVLEKNEEQLKKLVTDITEENVIFSSKTPSTNPDNPPIYYETPKWASSFRTFLELFATPRYNELNPTVFMGIFFIIFFGFMLGDAGYGLILLILSLVGYFKFGKHSGMLKTWSFLGIMLGITTTIVGFLMNSFFGDFIPRFFGTSLYSATIFGIKLPLEPLEDPLTILAIALVFGIIHLNLGIILGIVQSFHRRDYKSLITKHFAWIPMQIGGGLLVGNFIMGWTVEGILFYTAAALTLVGIILLFINAGPIGFFDITGYVGDWLSYARLLALGLATGGMALAFNVVSELIGGMIPVVGVIIMSILLIFSHLVNLGLQALGAGVHSLRLQYVEFFNRFYEGGGRKFSPFKLKRKYTTIEENID